MFHVRLRLSVKTTYDLTIKFRGNITSDRCILDSNSLLAPLEMQQELTRKKYLPSRTRGC